MVSSTRMNRPVITSLDQGLGTEAHGQADHSGAGQQRADVDAQFGKHDQRHHHRQDGEHHPAKQWQQGADAGATRDHIAVSIGLGQIAFDAAC